jgi:hypothetical protein
MKKVTGYLLSALFILAVVAVATRVAVVRKYVFGASA